MINQDYFDVVLPRNEQEIAELFNDFLFWRWHDKSSPYVDEPSSKEENDLDLTLSDKGKRLLYKYGFINRIFRRWLQTNWGWNNWSRNFEGETPRQEFAHRYDDFNKGSALFSVQLIKNGNELKATPSLFLKEDADRRGGLFYHNIESSRQTREDLFPPVFDPGFRSFAQRILYAEKIACSLKSYNPPESKEGEYWMLFWNQAPLKVISDLGLELDRRRMLKATLDFQYCLDSFLLNQGGGVDDFIIFDSLFEALWRILQKHDKQLSDLEEMNLATKKALEKNISEEDSLYSLAVFYRLGVAFDEHVLFPADQYFGTAEIVWTDKEQFLHSFASTIYFLNNNLKIPQNLYDGDKMRERAAKLMKFEDTVFDLSKAWFCPPTAFRILPSAMQYFRK